MAIRVICQLKFSYRDSCLNSEHKPYFCLYSGLCCITVINLQYCRYVGSHGLGLTVIVDTGCVGRSFLYLCHHSVLLTTIRSALFITFNVHCSVCMCSLSSPHKHTCSHPGSTCDMALSGLTHPVPSACWNCAVLCKGKWL